MSGAARSLIVAQVVALTGLPLVNENATARPSAGTAWLTLVLDPDRAEGGTRWAGEGGLARLTLHHPLGEGSNGAETLARTLGDGLSVRRLSDDGAALVTGAAQAEPAHAEGAFWVLPLTLPYHVLRGR
ncbi:MAG: DUF4128 domain-containing protein [Rhodospirillum sp.]|nr:DUF4128 domain-containing protein [Rhodospirillum sp.]MCF8489632.1 DUF4128 domain-containing protein [Rhodospirillum sp.]